MVKPRGKNKEIILTVIEIEKLLGEASSCIDTSRQHEIRRLLDEAINKCQGIRNEYDPI